MHIKIIIIIIMIIIIYYYHNQYYHYYYRCIYTHLRISYIHVHTWKSQHRCIEILVSACSEVTLLILLPAGGSDPRKKLIRKSKAFDVYELLPKKDATSIQLVVHQLLFWDGASAARLHLYSYRSFVFFVSPCGHGCARPLDRWSGAEAGDQGSL